MREQLPPRGEACPINAQFCLADLCATDCSLDETQLHPFFLAERLCVYGVAGTLDRRESLFGRFDTPDFHRRQGNLCIDLALAAQDDEFASHAFGTAERELRSVIDNPDTLPAVGVQALTSYNYLPVFKRRREEQYPSAETIQMARIATADTLAAALRLHNLDAQQGRALIAERAVEGLLLRSSSTRLLPYPTTDREDMGAGVGKLDNSLKPCLHDSYVIMQSRKVPIQTKFAGRFQESPNENNYYHDMVAKVSYRETCKAALGRMRGWDNRRDLQFELLLANRLVADLRGEHISTRMDGALKRATEHVWNIVRAAAVK